MATSSVAKSSPELSLREPRSVKTQGNAWLKPDREVGPHGVVHQRGDGQRLPAVPRDIADDEAQASLVELHHVMEVATGGRALGRTIGNG